MVAGRNGEQMGLEVGGMRCGLLGPLVLFRSQVHCSGLLLVWGGRGADLIQRTLGIPATKKKTKNYERDYYFSLVRPS